MAQATTERWSYYLLMGSLPPLPVDFAVGRLPISAPRLEERLRHLPDEDAREIEILRALLFWDRQKNDLTDLEVAKRYEAYLAEAKNDVAREVASFRMDVRTIVAALRRRRMGMSPPTGVGPWVPVIKRNWGDASLGLASRFPWVTKLDRHLADRDIDAANRLILDVVYRQWSRMASSHLFSLEALVLYVARWDVLDRWVSRSVDVGREKLEQLVVEAIGDYRRLF